MSKKFYVVPEDESAKMIKKAFGEGWLLRLKLRAWGNRKKMSKELLKEIAKDKFQGDIENVRAIKVLIDTEQVKRITRVQNDIKSFVAGRSMPWFDDSVFWINSMKVKDTDQSDVEMCEQKLSEGAVEIDQLREELRVAYPGLVQKALTEHPEFFNESDFPDVNHVIESFGIVWRWQKVTMPLNGDISVVGKDVIERENKKYVDYVRGAMEEHIQMIRLSMAKMLIHLRDKLKDPNEKFKDSTIEKPKKFLEELSSLRIPYHDKPFQQVANDIKEILEGVEGQDLRDDAEYRKTIASAVSDVVEVFEDLPVIQIDRALNW